MTEKKGKHVLIHVRHPFLPSVQPPRPIPHRIYCTTPSHTLYLGHKKLIIISQAPPASLSPPASKIFIAFQLINMKNRRHIVNYQFNLAAICLFMVGWLNSGAPALAIRHHLLKSEFLWNIVRTSFLFTKGKIKIKIKSRPPASFSEKSA